MNQSSITDAGVAGLPIHEGRAELLEEIMATAPVASTAPTAPSRRRRVLPILAAAAAVAAVVAGTAWLGQQGEPRRDASPTVVSPGFGSGDRAVLSAEGWKISGIDHAARDGGVAYANGRQRFDITWHPADQYDAYVADRNDIGTPSDIDLLGKASLLWAYDKQDHTVIRPVQQGVSLEVRGTGMPRAAFLDLLAQVRLVDAAGLADHVKTTEQVSREDRLYQDPPAPVLITADGWTPRVDDEGGVSWAGPGGAKVSQVWVSGVADPFTYDRYLDTANREEIKLLGERALLAEWQEGADRYRVAATSPLTGETILVLEATAMTRQAFVDVVRSAWLVPAGEYERVIRAAIK